MMAFTAQPRKRSLRSRLIPLTVLAAILPALLVGLMLVTQESHSRRQQVLDRLSDASEALHDRLADFGARTDSVLSTLTHSWSVAGANSQGLRYSLDSVLANDPGFVEFVVLDASGKPVVHLARKKRMLPESAAEWAHRPELAALRGQPYTSHVFGGPVRLPNMIRALPIRDLHGTITGALVARIGLEELRDLVAGLHIGKTGHAYVVDREGDIIAHPDPALVTGNVNVAHLPAVQRALRGETATTLLVSNRTEWGNTEPYFMYYQPSPPFGWGIVVEQARGEALAPVAGRLWSILAITLGLAALFMVVSTRVVARIIGPIKELRRGAEIIGAGNYGYRLAIHTGDEVEDLANEFNRMASRVRSAYEGMVALNQLSQEIVAPLEPAEIWQAACDGARKLTGADIAVAVALNGAMSTVAVSGIDLGACLPSDSGVSDALIARLYHETTPVRVDDLPREPQLAAALPECLRQDASLLWVPMLGKTREVFGGILLAHSTLGFFGTREEQLGVTLAAETAVALENAHLFRRVEEERYNLQAIFDNMAEGILVLEPDGKISHANSLAAEIMGLPVNEIEGRENALSSFGVRDLAGNPIPPEELPGLRAAKGEGVMLGREMLFKSPIRGERTLSVSAAPLRTTGGTVMGAVVTFRDITSVKEAEREIQRALESERRVRRELTSIFNAVKALTSTQDLTERLRVAAESLAGAVGVARCGLLLVEDDHLTPVLLFGAKAGEEAILRLLPTRLSEFKQESYLIEAITAMKPIVIPDASADPRVTLPVLRLLAMRSVLQLPLVYQGRTIGVALLDQPGETREFSSRDIQLAMAIAGQAAAILGESQLLEQAEARARQLSALFNVARAVVSALELSDVLDTIAEQTRNVMQMDAVSLLLIDEATREVNIRAWRGLSGEHVEKSHFRLGEGIAGRVAADGIPRVSQNVQNDPTYKLREVVRKEGFRSMLSVPITVRQQVIGVINLFTRESREFTPADITLVSTVASMAGTAIRNATVYERERHIAETLQTSLLPADLPNLPGLDIGYRYEPAGAEARVGGDFYDFFQLPDGKWGMMVGDVSGHGVGAAINTALVKYALRAYAYVDPDPAVVLRKLNDAVVHQMELGTFITVLYARLDPEHRALQISNAGHPFGVHYDAAKEECEVLEPGGIAVGIVPDQNYAEAVLPLAPGDALVLFTDGVTEAGPVDDMLGFEGITALVKANHSLDAQGIAEAIYRRVLEVSGGTTTDDVALLVLKAV